MERLEFRPALHQKVGVEDSKLRLRDFTLTMYRHLLSAFIDAGYECVTFEHYLTDVYSGTRKVILRHDVDANSGNALKLAQMQSDFGVRGTYYFRVTPGSFDEQIIRSIAELGHEIGYHYEDLSMARGNLEKAIEMFESNLDRFRKFYPVRTICMHGSPLSKWDNRKIWDQFDYRQFGILGEPYFDVDYNEVAYLTDTGRCWNGAAVSVRDKVHCAFSRDYESTHDIIRTIQAQELPRTVMLTIHPHRWHDHPVLWTKELLLQNVKNVVKRTLIKLREKNAT